MESPISKLDFPSKTPSDLEDRTLYLLACDLLAITFKENSPSKPTYLRLNPTQITQPAPVPNTEPQLADDGFGLPAVIEALKSDRFETWKVIEDSLQKLIRNFKTIHIKRHEIEIETNETLTINGTTYPNRTLKKVPGRSFEVEFTNGARIPSHHVSEGTLLAITLLFAIHGNTGPRLLLLDDIDRALHPKAQIELIQFLKDAQKQNPELQIISTAHSPMILSGCKKEEIIELDFDSEGFPTLQENTTIPAWMTPTELMGEYFNITRLGIADQTQRYAFLADNPYRSDAEDQDLQKIIQDLTRLGVKMGWDPTPRKNPEPPAPQKGARTRSKA